MAGVLEKRERKTYLDDTTPLTVTIVTNRMRDTHVVSSEAFNILVYIASGILKTGCNYVMPVGCLRYL